MRVSTPTKGGKASEAAGANTGKLGDPFDDSAVAPSLGPKPLVNICSGVVASSEVTADLLNAYEKWKSALRMFVTDRPVQKE